MWWCDSMQCLTLEMYSIWIVCLLSKCQSNENHNRKNRLWSLRNPLYSIVIAPSTRYDLLSKRCLRCYFVIYFLFFSFFQWNVYHSRASRNREENDETMQQKMEFYLRTDAFEIFISKSHKTMCSEVLSRCGRDTIAIVVFLFIVFCYFEFEPQK